LLVSNPAKFEVSRVFNLPDVSRTVLAGRIVSGVISEDMAVHLLIDGGLFWTIPLESVEYVERDSSSEVALTISLQEGEDLALLLGLCPVGTTVDVARTESERA
jgi:hypothetical protein